MTAIMRSFKSKEKSLDVRVVIKLTPVCLLYILAFENIHQLYCDHVLSTLNLSTADRIL